MAGKGVVEHEQKQKKSSSSFCGSRNDNGDGCQPVLAANTDISKEETVYVNAAADGTPQEITVSDWLKNSASAGDLSDVSDLKDIKNVKGDETSLRMEIS
mgnify:CR=1 FL=1